MHRRGFVYILTNLRHTVLYIGVTSNLAKHIWEHTEKLVAGFTKKYNVTKLVYYESCEDIRGAIQHEKQLKAGSRQKKSDCINAMNPDWNDLSGTLL